MNKSLIAIMAALLGGTPALSADLYIGDPVQDPGDPAVVVSGGWYLRGHLGMSNQRLGSMEHEAFDDPNILHGFLDEASFDSAPLAGVGVGYQFNDWLRLDGIVEYRGKADFSALDRYDDLTNGSGWDGTNDYDGAKSEWLLMANAYVDIGDWNGIKPYIGAGIGASRNKISRFRDINVPQLGVAYADSDPSWNFAWALHAGVAYQATDRLAIDFGYSYVDLGDAKTGDIRTFDGSPGAAPMHFKDITSHDFKLGMRYKLQ
ncbi:MAG TPA: outer membrane protein [Sinorhizobium sp.]|nr:outer membrane protein [Sinorhizobium sp.]